MEKVTINKSDALQAYVNAKGELKDTLALLFGKQVIKSNPMDCATYEEICQLAGIDPEESLPFPNPSSKKQLHSNADFKLQTIFDEFNKDENGIIWNPDYSDSNEWKYYAWFDWSPSAGAFVFTYTNYTCTLAGLGARLCTNTGAKMVYIAKTFIKEWNEFLNPQI